jgi:hypothetical protein
MKILQNKFVRSLPKVILFLLAFYNFAWVYFENLSGCMGVACAWFLDDKVSDIPAYLLLASIFLLVPRLSSYTLAAIFSGFHSIKWLVFIAKFVYNGDQTFRQYLEQIPIYDNNPLTAFESQVILATAIFSLSIYCLLKEITAKKSKTFL